MLRNTTQLRLEQKKGTFRLPSRFHQASMVEASLSPQLAVFPLNHTRKKKINNDLDTRGLGCRQTLCKAQERAEERNGKLTFFIPNNYSHFKVKYTMATVD